LTGFTQIRVREMLTLPAQNVSLGELFYCERVAKMTQAKRGRYPLEFRQNQAG
jgi:hypothetical protein